MLERTFTGITDLDEMIGGGLIRGSANIVEGAPGTGKTTLGIQFIANGILHYDEPGLIITFEEFPSQYYHDALNFGWDLKQFEKEGKLKIIFSEPESILNDLDNISGSISEVIEEMGIRRCLVDSITHFEYAAADKDELRDIEFDFINHLKREQITSILLRENNNLLGDTNSISQAPFIADSYMIMRYVEIDSSISKALLVLKMRGSQHAKDIRQQLQGN